MSNLTDPEAFAHRRQIKRYTAALKRDGLCRACVHRECTLGLWHCRNAPERQRGVCMDGDGLPRFKVMENVLDEFADAA